jgi:coupling of ubiquitin conjugation to ER degradation protein 1
MTDDEPSLNIPSLLTLAFVSYFVFRWFFNRDSSPSAGGRGRGRGNAVDPASVAQISQMFPQLSTRDIMWDLQRNGGSVPATTERILTGRGLETVRIAVIYSSGIPPLALPTELAPDFYSPHRIQ